MPEESRAWQSSLYRNYIIGGLVGVVIVTVATALIVDARGEYLSRLPIFVGGGAVTLFLLGILGYWWWQIISGNIAENRALAASEVKEVPPLAALKSWTNLYQQMVLYGGVRENLAKQLALSNRKVVEWFAWTTLLALFPLANVWLYLLDVISQAQFLQFVRPAIITLAVLMLLRTYWLLGRGKGDYETEMLRTLGFSSIQKLGNRKRQFVGQRLANRVRVETQNGNSTTFLDAPVPLFSIKSIGGKFQEPNQLPASLRAALDLPKAKRWQDIRIEGNQQGIRIHRQSRGQNMWLFDLWLAERLAVAAQAEAPN